MHPTPSVAAPSPPDARARLLGFLGSRAFLWLVVGFFLLTHLYRLDDPPTGFHKWRESDTAAVAYNFLTESWDFSRPRIDARGAGDGVVGMELPVYSYATAILYAALGYSHAWPRLLTVVGACLLLLQLHRLGRRLTGSDALAGLAAYLASVSPLLVFYGRRIQPDVWALALAVAGLTSFVAWIDRGRARDGALSAACVALAAGLKPTALCVGLPMLVLLVARFRLAFLRQGRTWLFALACLAPAYLWFAHAARVNPATAGYFQLGVDWREALATLGEGRFYRRLLLTSAAELVIGLPVAWAFLWGLWRIRACRGWPVVAGYLAGCTLVFLGLAHVTAAHDYYLLPAVAATALVTAHGALLALRHPRRALHLLALLALLAMPVYAWARIGQRLGARYDFARGRALADAHLPSDARVIAHEKSPCVLLYRTGRKGWWLPAAADRAAFLEAVRGGARFLLVDDDYGRDLTRFEPFVGAPLYRHEGVTVYPIGPALGP